MKKFLCVIHFLLLCIFLSAQEEAADCKDHPLFKRMPGTIITECIQKVEKASVITGDNQSQVKEGIITDIDYSFSGGESSAPDFGSIVKYHESMVQKLNGKKIYEGKNAATFSVSAQGKNIWVQVNYLSNISPGNYGLVVIETESNKTADNARDIGDQLSQSGKVTFYFSFDKNKPDLTPETLKVLNQLVIALRQHPFTKISIEAHTDLAESESENQGLSEAQAKNIMNYLHSKGIGKFRMKSRGWGQSKPSGDKSTAEGQARNRRIEILRQDQAQPLQTHQ